MDTNSKTRGRSEVLHLQSPNREVSRTPPPSSSPRGGDDGAVTARMTEPNRWLMTLSLSYEDMLRSAVDWLWECNAQLVLTYVSEPLANGQRLPRQMAVGRSLSDLSEARIREAGSAAVEERLENREIFRDLKIAVAMSNGQIAHFRMTGVPLYDRRSGTFVGYRGTGCEIAEPAAEESVEPEIRGDEQLLGLLENALARKDQLEWELSRAGHKTFESRLAAIAHELRTPLNAIVGFAEIIKTRALGADLDRYVDYGGDIYESGIHMVALVNNLIDLAKIDSPKEPAREEKLGVHDVVSSALRMLDDQAEEAGIKLVNHIREDLPRIAGEPSAIRQIFLNLLFNAIKYTQPGGAVGVEGEANGDGGVSVVVWDTGIGIALDEQDRIFERNYRIKGEANAGKSGSGLGLAISRDLAKGMGGNITVTSKPGHGARFTVRLPTARAVAGDGSSES